MSIKISAYDKFKPISNARARGNYGSVYKYEDEVIKLFKDDKLIKQCNIEENLKKIIDSKIKIDGVALPTNLVYKNNKFCGYTMPYFNGPTLTMLLGKISKKKVLFNENELYNLYFSLVEKIKKLSKNNIKANDIKPDNIIYYNGELCLVDCDAYKMVDMKNLEEYNLSLLDKCFKKIDIFKNVIYKDDLKVERNKVK